MKPLFTCSPMPTCRTRSCGLSRAIRCLKARNSLSSRTEKALGTSIVVSMTTSHLSDGLDDAVANVLVGYILTNPSDASIRLPSILLKIVAESPWIKHTGS